MSCGGFEIPGALHYSSADHPGWVPLSFRIGDTSIEITGFDGDNNPEFSAADSPEFFYTNDPDTFANDGPVDRSSSYSYLNDSGAIFSALYGLGILKPGYYEIDVSVIWALGSIVDPYRLLMDFEGTPFEYGEATLFGTMGFTGIVNRTLLNNTSQDRTGASAFTQMFNRYVANVTAADIAGQTRPDPFILKLGVSGPAASDHVETDAAVSIRAVRLGDPSEAWDGSA